MSVRASKPALLGRLQAGHQVIEASAGTGKTYTLQRLVADLVIAGTPLERILVVTFTDKATQELLTRIREYLQLLLNQDTDDEAAPFWEIDEQGRAHLAQALRTFERATIATIHGFCRQVLQEAALEGKTLFDRELVDERGLFARAFRHALAHDFTQHPAPCQLLEASLAEGERVETIEQELWNVHTDGGLLLPTLATWAAWIGAFDPAWFADLNPLLALWKQAGIHANTLKAAKEGLPRLGTALQKATSDFQRAQAFEVKGATSIWKAAAQMAAVPGDHGPLQAWLAAADASRLEVSTLRVHCFLPAVHAAEHRLMQEEGLFTFHSMIQGVAEALAAPDGEALAQRLRSRYDLALVDEFQDTDPLQWEIFQRLFDQHDRRLILIGDPKQAIYGFRGGDLPTYQRACRQLLQGAEPQRLEHNFRSTPAIIDAYNHLLSGDGSGSFFRDAALYPRPVGCGRPGLQAWVGAAPVTPVDVLVLDTLTGGQGLWRRLAQEIARRIQQTVAAGLHFGEPGHLRTLGYGDVQVLVGKAAEGELMARALRAEGIPCAFYKQKGLYQTREAEEWLDALRAVAEPRNRSFQVRAFLSAFFGYDLEDLRRLPAMPDDHPALQRLVAWGLLAQQQRFGEMFETMLEESGLVCRLLLCETGQRALVNFRHIAEGLVGMASRRCLTLEDLIRQLERWRQGFEKPAGEDGELQRLEGDRNAVQILTLHAAKGLEAPIVAIFAFGKAKSSSLRRFHENGERCLSLGAASPQRLAQAKEEARDEQERLLYVGLTRAQAKLILCAFDQRKKDGELAKLHSPYDALNARLVALRSQREELFAWEELQGLGNTPPEETPRRLPLETVLPPLPAPLAPWDYAAMAQAARPFFTTSFTALQNHLEAEEPYRGDPDQPGLLVAPGDLPKGTRSGRVLHELLEWADLSTLETAETWCRRPEVRAQILATLEVHGLSKNLHLKVAEVVHAALTTDLPLAWGGSLQVNRAERVARELDFLARFLEADIHPEERDLLKGSIDVLCEQGGRIYLLDWKNSLLPDYEWSTLQATVDQHYRLQAQVYLQAVLACFGLHDEAAYEARFGGILYVFLRGLPRQGTWSIRPTWTEVQGWKADLQRLHQEVAHG